MIPLLAIHIAAGVAALPAGALAVAAAKGGRLHARAGTTFCAAMLVLGVTAAILERYRSPPASPIAGLMVCYFVATAWAAVRRRDGTTGRFELLAGIVALATAAAMAWGGLSGAATTPVGPGPVYAVGGLCLLAGLGDLRAWRAGALAPLQRVTRHLWRMSFAFFIATGSFFIGQQQVLPAALRGSPVLLALGFAPFAVLTFWLVRVCVAKRYAGWRPSVPLV